jgi:membrane associated rhomboid family serine protease
MGIYDRDYYRKEGPSFLGTFANRGQVCKWLVIINVLAFIVQILTLPRNNFGFGGLGSFTNFFILDAEKVLDGQVWRLLTYGFLHDPGSVMHILFNMLFLWWFGHELEELYGHWEFLTFYLVSVALGGIAFTLIWKTGIMPAALCLGASGGVTAVMVLYAFHFPHQTILVMFILPVPIWALVVFQVAQDTLIFVGRFESGVAVTVHLAGAAFAALYHQTHMRLLNLWPGFRLRAPRRNRPRLRVYREAEPETPQPVPVAPQGSEVDEQLEAKVDAVLEKVARSGQASLTEHEKQLLLRASEIYKKRRS